MKITSISLIAAALAAIAANSAATPRLDIYSRGLPVCPDYPHNHQHKHYHTGLRLKDAASVHEDAARHARGAGSSGAADKHERHALRLTDMASSHFDAAKKEYPTDLHNLVDRHMWMARKMKGEGQAAVDALRAPPSRSHHR